MKKLIATLFAFAILFLGHSVFATNNNVDCTITQFDINGSVSTTVSLGNSVNLIWATNNCSSVTVSGPSVSVNSFNGSQTIYPTSYSTYTIIAHDYNGGSQSQSVQVNVSNSNNNSNNPYGNYTYNSYTTCSITKFTANDSSSIYVQPNEAVKLTWTTDTCSSVSLTGPGVFNNSLSNGSQYTYPLTSGTYTLTAYGYNGGAKTRSVYVNVNSQNNSCTISNFTANGSNTAYITSGAPVVLVWNTTNCTSAAIPSVANNLPPSGSQTIYPTSGANLILNAYNSDGTTKTQTIQINVSNSNGFVTPAPVYNNTCAVTTVATNITKSTATLNGLVTNSNPSNTSAYFEYGTTVNMGSQTPTQQVSGNNFFNSTLTNLPSGTIYFFRANAVCQGVNSHGTIEIFDTNKDVVVSTYVKPNTHTNTKTTTTTSIKTVSIAPGNTSISSNTSTVNTNKDNTSVVPTTTAPAPTQVIVQGPTVMGTASPILLKIENRHKSIGVGDTVDYTVTYKNIGKSTLINPVLQIIAPKNIPLTASSDGTYSKDTNTITMLLDDLAPGKEGAILLQGRVESIPKMTAQIVTTAILIYTNTDGTQENGMAYILNTPSTTGNSTLGASAGSASSGIFPTTLVGWLLIVVLILLTILIVRSVYHKKEKLPQIGHGHM